MQHIMRCHASIALLLAILIVGCDSTVGVDDTYGVSYGYSPEPSYVNNNFETYSLGYPVYSSPSLQINPAWVTEPRYHYHTNYPYRYGNNNFSYPGVKGNDVNMGERIRQ